MSISANFPNVRPSLLLDFANSQQLDPRVTFSRSTTAPYYDGKTSVLAEQNLLTYSQDFTNGSWNKLTSTVTGNSTTAPDGTTTAGLITSSAGTALKGFGQTITLVSGSAYTYSIYLKYNTQQFIQIYFDGSANNYANFDIQNGTVGTNGSAVSSATITASTNGFYRLVVTMPLTSGSSIYVLSVDSSSASYGATTATTNSYYAWGIQREQRSSVTAYNATTTTAITNYIPQLLTAPINAPRFDFNPTTGESLGLLIEQQSTNLLLQSQFASGWTSYNPTLTQSANIAPDGTQTAVLMNSAIATGNQGIYRTSIAISATTSYTYSIYAKAGSANYVGISQSAANQGVIFNLSNGTFSANIVSAPASYSIASVGNGWYRCSITLGTNANTSTNVFVWVSENGTSTSYTGTGLGIYIWGAQLEALALATSYIPTTSAQVTRASDNASMTGTNFSSWYNNGQGTVYTEANYIGGSSASVNAYYSIDDGTTNNRLTTQIFSTNGFAAVTNNSIQANLVFSGTPTINTFYKQASSYANNNFIFSVNGQTALTSSTGLVPNNLTTLNIGKTFNANYYLNGRMKKFAYYPQIVTSAQSQALTGS